MDFRNELPTKKVKKVLTKRVLTSRLLSTGLALATAALLAATLVGCGERNGNTQPGTTPETSPASVAAAAEEPDAESVALYIANCSSCHAADGSGATGPAIGDGALNDKYTQAEMEALIRDGVDSMAGLGGRLNSVEIATIAEYVRNDLTASPTSVQAQTEAETETGTGTETGDPPPATPPADPPPTAEPPALGLPPEAIEFADDWPLPNQNLAGTRTAVNSPINSTNVAKMEEAWRFYAPGGGFSGNIATTPLIVGDSVYFQDLQGVVYALDRETGKKRWDAASEQNAGVMFGPTGVAVGWGKVFAAKLGNRGRGQLVAAYDAATGEELWATDVTSKLGRAELNIQPFVYDGMVFASTSGFPEGVRGTIFALTQASGEVVWSFSTIEDEGLWGNPELNSGGGVWYPPALDIETGTLYFGVGSPYPFPGAPGFPAGSSRPGDNRWTSGTIALDVRTGEFRWGFQAFPHDLFDRDHVLVALAELAEADGGAGDSGEGGDRDGGGGDSDNGEGGDSSGASDGDGDDGSSSASDDDGASDARRKVLVTAGKGNVVIGLDPASGEELWRTSVGMHQNDDLTSFDELIEVLPGAQGGIVTPIAVADGVAYVTAINAPTPYQNDETPSGGEGTRLLTHPSNVLAIDISDGSIIWDTLVDGKFIDLSIYQLDWLAATDVIGGATVVNDLLFTSTIFGRMLAIDRSTGKLVIDYQADNGINGWPAVAGNLIVVPVGFADQELGQTPHLLALRLPE